MSYSSFKFHAKDTRPDVPLGNEAITARQQPDIISANARVETKKQNNKRL